MSENNTTTGAVSAQKNPYRWVMLILVMLVYVIVLGFTNQSFNILLGTIVDDQGWTAVQKTAVSGAFATGMVWFCFVAGNVIDKAGAKKIMGSALVILAILIFMRGKAEGFMIWYVMQFLYGVVSAFYQPCVTKVATLWFDKDELPFANGCTTAASPIGQVTANLFAARIAQNLSGGWRQLYMIIGVIVAVLMLIWWIFAKERSSMQAATSSNIITENKLWENIKGVLSDPYVWCMILADAFFLGSIYAGGTYGAYTLQNDPGWMVEKVYSGYPSMMNNICSTCAYLLTPLICRKIKPGVAYKWWVMISGFIAPIFFIIGYRTYSLPAAMACFGLAGIMYGGIVPGTKVLMLQRPKVSGVRSGAAFGLMLTVERIFITICVNLLGSILFTSEAGLASTMSNYYFLQLLAPVCVAIAFIYDAASRKKSAQNG